MRQHLSTAAAFLLLSFIGPAAPAAAADEANQAGCGSYTDYTTCHETISAVTPGRPASTGGRRAVDPDYVSLPWVVRAGDPGTCGGFVEAHCSPSGLDLPPGTPDCIKAEGIGRAPELRDYARQQWQDVSATYRMCPSAGGEPELDPVVIAIRAWQDIPLPDPSPHIAPGWAITGKYAYLETNGERSHTYTTDTPLGPLTLEATGRYHVDWGDGTEDGPYSVEGRPWPDGEITHTYIDVGNYDVVVTEEWMADWRVGGFGGQLGGLRTEGRIPGFRVEQIQVVVGR